MSFGDSKTSRLNITIAYVTVGLSEARKNLQCRKPELSQDNNQLLLHKACILQLDDYNTIDNTANCVEHASHFFSFLII